jgi:hypothetical protein
VSQAFDNFHIYQNYKKIRLSFRHLALLLSPASHNGWGPDVISEGGQRWVKKALVKNGFLRATATGSVRTFIEQSEGQDMLFRSTGSVCTAMSAASAGLRTTSATSPATQPLSLRDPWKIEKPTVKVRCHRHPSPKCNWPRCIKRKLTARERIFSILFNSNSSP